MRDSIKWFIRSLKFWTDEWIKPPLVSTLNIPLAQQAKLDASVSDFLINGVWHLLADLPSDIKNDVIQIQPFKSSADVCVCTPSIDGK